MVKSAKEGNGAAAQRNPEAEERKRLKKLAISNKLVAEAPAATGSVLPPSKTVIKHHGRDILKKSSRKNRFLFSFPGLLAPISGGKIGELKDLGSKNPILYLDFPQGQMKLFGTIVYPKNRYLTLQFSRGGKNVMCEDYFDTLIVFSEAWWIGRKEDNPDEVRLEFPDDLNMGQQPECDFKGGAGSISEKLRVVDGDETKIVKQLSPKREKEHESSDSQDGLNDLMQVTPTRHSVRTAKKSYKFTETSSGDDSGKTDADISEEEDTADGLGTSTRNQLFGKTEHSSVVVFDIDDKDPEASTNYSEQLLQAGVSGRKSKDSSSKSHGSLVQATISTLFKKVEKKKAPEKLRLSSSSKVSHKKLEAESIEKTDQTKITPRTKGKAIKQKAGNKSTARRKEPEVDDDEIEEFSSMSQDTDESDEEWGA